MSTQDSLQASTTPINAAPPAFFDVAAYLQNGLPEPPAPVVGRCTDGLGLFYKGAVNQLYGDPESGKTFVALAAAVETMRRGEKFAFLDFDLNGPSGIIPRLIDLGATPAELSDPSKFRYAEPEDLDHVRKLIDALIDWCPDVVVIDSIGEVLPMFGASSNSPDDFTDVNRKTAYRLAKAGACVITIDHLAKNSDSRSYGSTGTAAKKRTVGGAYLRVVVEEQFAPGRGGSCRLTITKDRPGGLRAHRRAEDKEPIAATFRMHAEGPSRWDLFAPGDNEPNPLEVPRQ